MDSAHQVRSTLQLDLNDSPRHGVGDSVASMSMTSAAAAVGKDSVASWAIHGLEDNTSMCEEDLARLSAPAELAEREGDQQYDLSRVLSARSSANSLRGLKGIKISGFTGKIGDKLKQLDRNGDGVVDTAELGEAVDSLVKQEMQAKYWRYYSFAAAAAVVVLSGVLAGLTWCIVEQTKQTKVNNNYLVASGGDTNVPVVTAQYAFQELQSFQDLLTAAPSTILNTHAIQFTYQEQTMTSKVNSVLTLASGNSTTVALVMENGILNVNSTTAEFIMTDSELSQALSSLNGNNGEGSQPTRRSVVVCTSLACGRIRVGSSNII